MLKIIPEKLLEKQRKTVRATLSYSQFLSFVWGTQLSPIHEININIIYKKKFVQKYYSRNRKSYPYHEDCEPSGEEKEVSNEPSSQPECC